MFRVLRNNLWRRYSVRSAAACASQSRFQATDSSPAEPEAENFASDAGPTEEDANLENTVQSLLDDLIQCNTHVLKNFGRSRGAKQNHKNGLILELIELAVQEVNNPRRLAATRRILGEDTANAMPADANLSARVSDTALEASMLENACSREIKGKGMGGLVTQVRQHSHGSSQISQKLLRVFQDDFDPVQKAAFGGMYKTFKDKAKSLVERTNPGSLISAFTAFLTLHINQSYSPGLVSAVDVPSRLVDINIVKPTIEDGHLKGLERYMEMLDMVAEDVKRRMAHYSESPTRNWGQESTETLKIRLELAKSREKELDLDDVPRWVTEMCAQFTAWESIIKNDISVVRNVPDALFDSLLLGVVAYRSLIQLHGEDSNSVRDIPSAYRQLIADQLALHCGEHADDALLKINHHVQVEKADKAQVTHKLFEAIYNAMQATVPEENAPQSHARVGLILQEYAISAGRSEKTASLYRLAVQLTEDLTFHLRFVPVYEKMTTKEKHLLRTAANNMNMIKTLAYFEQVHKIEPVDPQAVGFVVLILMYFCTRQQGSSSILTRYVSCTGREELSVVTFAERRKDRLSTLKVALPPQVTRKSWLGDGQAQVYSIVPANAVKSSTSQIMLMSQAPMIKALDAISSVPWRLNKYIMHVQEAMLQEGYGFGKLKSAFYPLTYARMRDGFFETVETEEKEIKNGREIPRTRKIHNQEMLDAWREQQTQDWRQLSDLRSGRIHYIQAMRQARVLINTKEIFFPHNMDFRGRMYPLPGRLNHTGSDPFRALLEYAHPKPLGERGLFWLKVHLANKMGQSKISFDERAQYVDEHKADVIQSAEMPLGGDRWWQEGEEPLQALAACKELADAWKHPQSPELFESRLPIAVDGSYNGLQHYSAIGRDSHGAKLVNLVPSDRPADAYTGILKVMMESILMDKASHNEMAEKCIGSGIGMDKNHIKRKTIKRPIMTQVYGVTQFGMAEQIKEELIKQNQQHGLWSPIEIRYMAAYIRDKINESLGVTFGQTQKCREWLELVSKMVWQCQPRDLKTAFMWTTPLGLVVRQPYRKGKESHLFTSQGYTRIGGAALEPASSKQLTALAPNLIHSLDATHMAMTALAMKDQNLNMMAVHDSYWTYACDIESLSKTLRRQFVDLYTNFDPLLEIKRQWEEIHFLDLRRHGLRLPDPPERGDFNIQDVLKSDYFFS